MVAAKTAKDRLSERIQVGEWGSGEKLPSERALSETLGVNRMSLRQALLSLENDGMIFRLDRRGWFVSQSRFIYDLTNHVGFHRAAKTQGDASWHDTEVDTVQADTQNSAEFGIHPGSKLFRYKGWGAFNGHRIFTHDVLINGTIAPEFQQRLQGGSFTTTWQKVYKIDPIIAALRIRPVRLEGEAQQLLGCSNGAPGLYLKRMKQSDDGTIIQIDREFWRFEAVELNFEREVDWMQLQPFILAGSG